MKRAVEATIDYVCLEPNKIKPIIVHFQNGELKENEADNIDCGMYYDEKTRNQVLALSNGQVAYKGYRPQPEEQLTYTMLALHNKKTGKVRLVQVERWQVAPVLDRELDTNVIVGENKIHQLNKEFGSKRVKRRTEQLERMKLNVEAGKEKLEATVSEIHIEKSELTLPSVNDESATGIDLPECNRNASVIEEVYDLNDIVPCTTLETLYDACSPIIAEPPKEKSIFFTQALQQLSATKNNTQKIALLLYIDAVAAWLNTPIKVAKKRGVVICPFSNLVNKHIIKTYSMTSSNGRQRPQSMRDKGLMHCIILSLLMLNFQLDLNTFSMILKNRTSMKKLLELARFIGAVPLKDNKSVVVLKLPLPPPLVMVRRNKRK